MIKSKIFIDSNFFVYLLDNYNPEKSNQAKKILNDAAKQSQIYISTQVINEVYAVATRKLNVEPLEAKKFVKELTNFNVVIVDSLIIEKAINISILSQINYWDALMISAADIVNCPSLLTEDMNHGQKVNGVEIINPFL